MRTTGGAARGLVVLLAWAFLSVPMVHCEKDHIVDRCRSFPGQKLSGSRVGQYSIRINDQYRLCFVWDDGNAHDVHIVDYH